MAGPPLPPVEERALTASWFSNGTALLALAVSIMSGISAIAACEQATRANDTIDATRASNVYFDSDNIPGQARAFSVVNRNKEPVLDVYYTYRLARGPIDTRVFVGVIPGCSRVDLIPPNGDDKKVGFTPVDLFLRDNNGNSWHREQSGQVDHTKGNAFTEPNRDIEARGRAIEGC